MSRKIGVGFNHPLVLEGRMQFDWRRTWDFARRLARYGRQRASAVEAHSRLVINPVRKCRSKSP